MGRNKQKRLQGNGLGRWAGFQRLGIAEKWSKQGGWEVSRDLEARAHKVYSGEHPDVPWWLDRFG